MKGLLLAGGHGTRLRPLTFMGNKHMLPIANKPMILYGLEHLLNAGIKKVGVILGPVKEGVVELLGDGSKYGAEITYIDQPQPKGLSHAILVSEDFLKGEPFVMYLGDNLLKQGVSPFIDVFDRNGSDCVIGVSRVVDPSSYGVALFDGQGNITKLIEKPKDQVSDWALIGVYVFNNKVFDSVKRIRPSWRGELEITDAIQLLLEEGAKVDVQRVQGWWKDTGKPEDLLEANQLVLQSIETYNSGKIEDGATVTGQVGIGRETIIRSGATIRGPTIVGEKCEIGPNAYVGPYTSVGNGVIIKNSEIENSIVMEGTHIECRKRIVDSVIGRGVRALDSDRNLPKGHKLILGDMAYVSL